ncbi:unnamed protein product [Alopecurus aequalis]
MGNGKVYATIVLIRLIYAGMHILTKASFEEGMSTTVFVFYRHAVAAVFLAPFAFFLEIRKGPTPPLTLRLSVKIFVHSFYGMAGTINLYSIGLNYASATSSSAIFNIVPVVAFILAVMFRMETLKLKSVHGMAKFLGILLCIGGVVALALYQGPQLKSFNHHPLLQNTRKGADGHPEKNWALGIFLMTASVVIWSLWTVKQGPLLLEYPSKLLNTTLQCTFASVQSFLIALVMERDFSRWKLAGGYCCRRDLVLPADLGDREERPGVPVHVDAAEPRLHHGDRLVPLGGGRQHGKHYRWRAARCRSLCRALGQGQGGARGGESTGRHPAANGAGEE